MTDGGVDRSVECTGNVDAMISAFECVHDVCIQNLALSIHSNFNELINSKLLLLGLGCCSPRRGAP